MKQFAIALAKKAGTFLLRHFQKDHSLVSKRTVAKGLHTRYDQKSDQIIVSAIKKRYPTHNILTEESGYRNKNSEYTWIIDPLDGSTNFARGIPFFAVSIAVMKGKDLVIGVVYAPFLKELYVAEKGKGAFLNNKKLHVSKTTTFNKSYFLSCEGGDATNKRLAKINALFNPKVKDLRKLGSAALESSSVASERADAYIVPNIAPWDVAAGVLIVEEAGGKVTDFTGKPWKPQQGNYVFSNGRMHQKILSLLR